MTINSVPFFRMKFSKKEINAVNKVLASGWLTTGKIAKDFEREFGKHIGARYNAAVSSCTSGLMLGLKALGIGKSNEVITSPYTFVASVEAIIHAGAKPVFADIDSYTLNLDPEMAERKINTRTRAILPVHIAGLPCRMDRFRLTAKKHGLYLVYDAAHAIGARFKNKKIGSFGDFSSFSFYATKNLTTGEGGMVATGKKKLAEKVQILSLHGMDRKAWRRYLDQGSWYYEVVDLGYKCNLPDMNAALGLAMLERLEKLQQKRQRAAGWYDEMLSKFDELELPARKQDSVHAWHLYIIKLNLDMLKINRDQFIAELGAYNIGTSVHFIPLFLHPYFKGKYGLTAKNFPNALKAFQRVISLPFFPDLRREEVRFVANSIGKIIVKYRK
jgi:dTDP-4-amino-4,6-dideoxygalactose transaminase